MDDGNLWSTGLSTLAQIWIGLHGGICNYAVDHDISSEFSFYVEKLILLFMTQAVYG